MIYKDAIDWLKRAFTVQACDGISAMYDPRQGQKFWHLPYPEIAGYCIPTLIDAGEEEIALRISRWLRKKQFSSGAIPMGYFGSSIPFVFDTGQVLLGWIAAQELAPDPRTEESIKKAVEWMEEDWRVNQWFNANIQAFSPSINLRALWPLKILGSPIVDEVLNHYLEKIESNGFPSTCDEQRPDEPLTHFLIYVARGSWELDERSIARKIMNGIAKTQTLSFPARLNKDFEPVTDEVCVPAIAQASILWRKMGEEINANRANIFLGKLDAPWASIPIGGEYLPNFQVSWSAKFIADALRKE